MALSQAETGYHYSATLGVGVERPKEEPSIQDAVESASKVIAEYLEEMLTKRAQAPS
jgi:hypothetical protein